MVFRTYTAACLGLEVYPVEVEVDGKQGIPQFVLIGLANRAVEEAKERITSALSNCGIRIRSKRTVVNLAPASVPKSGTAFDLAIAVGLLKMYGELRLETAQVLFIGELALDGQIKSVPGVLPLVLQAKRLGFKRVVLPHSNVAEVETVRSVQIFPISHLSELLQHPDNQHISLQPISPRTFHSLSTTKTRDPFQHIIGQDKTKKALVLVAAGGHHTLLCGSPGSGKTQLAQALSALLPALNEQESIELTAVHSLAGLTTNGLCTQRPFRSPHHTISRTGLLGGGNPLRPGEVSLAHHGVLFLDELLEFPAHLLDTLRQPLESRKVTLSFSSGRTDFPASTTLVAATNPCPCGYFGSSQKPCTCSPKSIEKYRQKLSGPLLDRFDITLNVEQERRLFEDESGEMETRSQITSTQVVECRQRQQASYAHLGCSSVSQLSSEQVKELCLLEKTAKQVLQREALNRQLTGRGYWATIKVAQTLADLEHCESIYPAHIMEALRFRELTV